MKIARTIVQLPLELLQIGIALLIMLPIRWIGRGLFRLESAIMRGPYYQVARWRRMILKQPLWQPHDVMIGVFQKDDQREQLPEPMRVGVHCPACAVLIDLSVPELVALPPEEKP